MQFLLASQDKSICAYKFLNKNTVHVEYEKNKNQTFYTSGMLKSLDIVKLSRQVLNVAWMSGILPLHRQNVAAPNF